MSLLHDCHESHIMTEYQLPVQHHYKHRDQSLNDHQSHYIASNKNCCSRLQSSRQAQLPLALLSKLADYG